MKYMKVQFVFEYRSSTYKWTLNFISIKPSYKMIIYCFGFFEYAVQPLKQINKQDCFIVKCHGPDTQWRPHFCGR